MNKVVQMRAWQGIGLLDRIARIAFYVGFILFCMGWMIEFWLTSSAISQPRLATGLYQNPWPFKGRIGYLTNAQIAWAHYENCLLYGWGFAAIGGFWSFYVERKAERKRADLLLKNFQLNVES